LGRHLNTKADFLSHKILIFLVLPDGDVDQQRTDRVRHQLHEIEWDTGEVLCAIVRSRNLWKCPQYQVMPLLKNLKLEGVTL
jgi:hypothetical protein